MLEARLIGTFDVKYNGNPVIISSRAAQSLFAYLILSSGTLHRREKLAGMFWPDAIEGKARAYLRHELWLLRKTLPSKSKFDYLFTDDISVSFNASAEYWLDVTALTSINDSASVKELMNTLSVFQGELLPGFYEDWIVLEREQLQALFERKISRLLELLEGEKCWQEILEWAERWISLGQGPEAAYRYLMIAYNALGDHVRVTSTFERCRNALRALDLEPSEQTRALAFKRTTKLNIPIPLTSFIGREKELKEVVKLFSKSRLITLTGSGGVGKTRLAIQVVADVLELFPDGVWFLDLAPLGDSALVPNTLGKVLDLQLVGGSDLSIIDLIADYLCSRTTLLIFDNCEHLIDGCASLVELLLKSCEGLHILATSREMLRVPGEITYRVPSLVIPPEQSSMNALAKIEAVQLFMERAKTISPNFELLKKHALSIAQICQRLDGIPLAIELAAARVEMLSVVQIAGHLDDCFRLLTRGARTVLPRHQTMRAVIDWSYNLLSNEEKSVLTGLSIFVGGWTLEAAEAVCESANILNLLTYLVDKSLVTVEYDHGDEPRYYLLETIRQYAREKLTESGEAEQVRAHHLDFFLQLAEIAEPKLYGRGQIEWMQKLEDEHDNISAALEWSLQTNITKGQVLTAMLWWSWDLNGHVGEGYEWLEKMLAVNPKQKTLITAKLLSGAGWLASMLDNIEQAKKYSEESVALFHELSNDVGSAFPLGTLGVLAYWRADYELAIKLAEQSLELFKRGENKWGVRHISTVLGYLAEAQGDLNMAQKLFYESLSIANEIGDYEGKGYVLYRMGLLAELQGTIHGRWKDLRRD